MITAMLYSLLALDQTLASLAAQHVWLLFIVLFLIIFAETGLVIFPLLPGDSLLFLAGAVAASSGINVHLLVLAMTVAAILGDTLNYTLGHLIGPKAFNRPPNTWLGRALKPAYLKRTQDFYEKYGGSTIIVGRFVPIVRTFAPFLAGVAEMRYRTFISYNIVGGIIWVASLTYAGFVFGNLPWVKENLTFIVIGIVLVSLLPILSQYLGERKKRKRSAS